MRCEVPLCLCDAQPGAGACVTHEHARSAKELRLGPDSSGRGAVRCGKCRRAFKDDDLVDRQSRLVKTGRGPVTKWMHAHCDPPSPRLSRKQIRESEKPLLRAEQ